MTILDTNTNNIVRVTDVDEFREMAKLWFDQSVHDVVDALADALEAGEYPGGLEEFLGIQVL